MIPALRSVSRAVLWATALALVAAPLSLSAAETNPPVTPKPRPAAAASPLAQRASKWWCGFKIQYSCRRDGCEPYTFDPLAKRPDENGLAIDFQNKTYKRPGGKPHPFTARVKGDETRLLVPAQTAFLRIANDGSKFVDVISDGDWSISSFGSCRPR